MVSIVYSAEESIEVPSRWCRNLVTTDSPYPAKRGAIPDSASNPANGRGTDADPYGIRGMGVRAGPSWILGWPWNEGHCSKLRF